MKNSRFTIHHFDTLDSTQIEARRGYVPGNVIVADIQTAGYGRRGREWKSPSGNLSMTMVEHWNPAHLSWISYAIGLGLHDAVLPMLNAGSDLKLKWPNDLLLNGAKLSGMLLEVEDDKLLIGIGVNIATTPETDQAVTKINDHTSKSVMPMDVVQAFLPAYEHWLQAGINGGFSALREGWMSRAAFRGQDITARLADGRILTGLFTGLDDNGGLVMATENGHDTITTADIYLDNKKKNK